MSPNFAASAIPLLSRSRRPAPNVPSCCLVILTARMMMNYKNRLLQAPPAALSPFHFAFGIGRPQRRQISPSSVDFARRRFAADKVTRREPSRPERLIDDLHQLNHALFVPLPSDHLHADRQPRHVLRVIDPARTVHALFKDLAAPAVGAPALVPRVREAVPRRVDERDGDLADGRIDNVPLDRTCTSRSRRKVPSQPAIMSKRAAA